MSITYIGIIIAVAGTFLTQLGFSETCSSELVEKIPLLIGGVVAAYGRFRLGGINIFGARV